jgi:hypothetical protein
LGSRTDASQSIAFIPLIPPRIFSTYTSSIEFQILRVVKGLQ